MFFKKQWRERLSLKGRIVNVSDLTLPKVLIDAKHMRIFLNFIMSTSIKIKSSLFDSMMHSCIFLPDFHMDPQFFRDSDPIHFLILSMNFSNELQFDADSTLSKLQWKTVLVLMARL